MWVCKPGAWFPLLLSAVIECVTLGKTLASLCLSFPTLQDGGNNDTTPQGFREAHMN